MQYSIINFSEAKKEKRFDAEFYKNDYVKILNNILKHNYKFLYEIASNKYKKLPNNKKDIEWKYIEIDKIICFQNDYNYTIFLKGDTLPSRASKIPKLHDIIISTVRPTRGAICIFNDIEKDIIVSSGFSIVHTDKINNNYLYTVLSSSFYLKLYKRLTKASMYPAMSEEDLFNLPIPIFSDEFQKSIEKLVLEAHNQRHISNSLMKEANEILEKEIGFDKLEIKKKKVNYSIVNYSETLLSKRIDAEYYQEKYKIIMDKIQSYKNGCIKITDLNSINNKLVSIDKNKKYKYIELSNIDSMGFIDNLELYYGYELPSRARRLLNNNDVIISSVEGSLDKSSFIYNNKNNLLCSTGFLVFNENEFINPETLFCFFRLSLIKELLKKISKGTILTAFDSNAICDMDIPNLDKNVQNLIANKVQEAYKARDRAKALLEEAKKKVEDAIENGEN